MCEGLSPDEFRRQPFEDASPPWWNLGHTSWFFARNVLTPFGETVEQHSKLFDYVLNSYYHSLGKRLPRGQRGAVTRPTTAEIYAYRASVDERVADLVESIDERRLEEMLAVLRIGIEHEQQHQELFYTEIKAILAQQPADSRRAYRMWSAGPQRTSSAIDSPLHEALHWLDFDGGLFEFGCRGDEWCWDNELPVHEYFLPPFALADRLVTNGEYLQFVSDGGYQDPLLWLDNGWRQVEEQHWKAPLYWQRDGDAWQHWTLSGMRPLDPHEPVCHVSFYEADAFARWKAANDANCRDARLPSEREWEYAAHLADSPADGNAFLDSGRLHPAAARQEPRPPNSARQEPEPPGVPAAATLRQMAGVLWQWTSSYYEPYPGYRPFAGALAEYNGKFMDNQRVLRGGSCVTPRDHYRHTYRNFWPAWARFQFTGIRLARTLRG
jgi:ergothioneine biosynthesis protein EgtB